MTIKINESAHQLVIDFIGEIDHHSAKKVLLQLDLYLQKKTPAKTVFNFERVDFMDSSGIAIILRGYKLTREYDGIFQIVNAQAQPFKVMQAAGLSRIVNIKTAEPNRV